MDLNSHRLSPLYYKANRLTKRASHRKRHTWIRLYLKQATNSTGTCFRVCSKTAHWKIFKKTTKRTKNFSNITCDIKKHQNTWILKTILNHVFFRSDIYNRFEAHRAWDLVLKLSQNNYFKQHRSFIDVCSINFKYRKTPFHQKLAHAA